MTAVHTSTDQLPELQAILETRHRLGLDTRDEWWEGTYRTVTGPSPEHGELVAALTELFGPLVRDQQLKMGVEVNIGIDRVDARVPDLAVYRPNTARTSPAFLATALLVVEVLSPGETPGEKLPFYAACGVHEYLEVHLHDGHALLLTYEGLDAWTELRASDVIGFQVRSNTADNGQSIHAEHGRVNLHDYRPV